MSSRIICTPGGPTDNSYVTAAQANAYFDDDLRSDDWTANATDDRERALISATGILEGLGGEKRYNYSPARALFPGTPYRVAFGPQVAPGTIVSQALHFPRWEDYFETGWYSPEVPKDIRDAVCEQALWLLQQRAGGQLMDHQANRDAGVSAIAMDGLSVSYKATKVPRNIAPLAWEIIAPWIATAFATA